MLARRRSLRIVVLSLLAVVGVGCIAIAGLGIWDYLRTTGHADSMPSTETLTQTTNTPSEKSPGPVSDKYEVPNGQPRAIQIPDIHLEAYVQRVGVDTSNIMVAPDNVYFTGWYTGSVAPGNVGVSIINGHAGGRYEQGVFRYIVNLKSGDTVRVQMGDHSWREFRVESTKSYTVADSQEALFADTPSIERELHLITCDGVFDDRTQTYDRRFIVVAKAI